MKQIRFLATILVAMLCLGFYSCDKDEDKDSSEGGDKVEISAANLVGTWQETLLYYRITDSNGTVIDSGNVNEEELSNYEFHADGTYIVCCWENGKYEEVGKGFYLVEKNRLLMSRTQEFNEGHLNRDIIELKENRLILEHMWPIDDNNFYYEKATYKRIK